MDKYGGYRVMRKTKLKEMYIVRYADDFRIFCGTKTAAQKTKIAITQWLAERLKLEVSQGKTKVVNVKHRYSEFLGFKIRVHSKSGKQVVKSHISDKQLKSKKKVLIDHWQYNKIVVGMQNYYRIATHINKDMHKLNWAVMTVITRRLKGISRKGRELTPAERIRYGKSEMLRYLADEPIYPIGYVQNKIPMSKSSKAKEATNYRNLRAAQMNTKI